MRSCVAVLICVLPLIACSDAPGAPDGPVDVRLVLVPGQAAAVAGTSLSLTFEQVAGDSRCPGDAICITGGDAIVRVRVTADRRAASYDLHTGDLKPARHDNVTIALEELSPYPFASLPPIQPGDYRAKVRVTR